MAGLRVHFVFPPDLVERIDRVAGLRGWSRGEWVRRVCEGGLEAEETPLPPFEPRAVEQALSEAKEPSAKQQADRGSVPSSEGVRSAAPAEQPEEVVPFAGWPPISDAEAKREQRAEARARSSSAAKRDVRPVPKKGEK